MKHFLLITAVLASLASLSACNTMDGIGKDIQKAGQSIEEAARKK
jgi:predicted small secreted protein